VIRLPPNRHGRQTGTAEANPEAEGFLLTNGVI